MQSFLMTLERSDNATGMKLSCWKMLSGNIPEGESDAGVSRSVNFAPGPRPRHLLLWKYTRLQEATPKHIVYHNSHIPWDVCCLGTSSESGG